MKGQKVIKDTSPVEVDEAEIRLPSGKVLHFKQSLGDKINIKRVVTEPTGKAGGAGPDIVYYTLTAVPVDEGQKDAI
jgi:hypothetical protein